jgi:hypothetical protein
MALQNPVVSVTVQFDVGTFKGRVSGSGVSLENPGPRGGAGHEIFVAWRTWDEFVAKVAEVRDFLGKSEKTLALEAASDG